MTYIESRSGPTPAGKWVVVSVLKACGRADARGKWGLGVGALGGLGVGGRTHKLRYIPAGIPGGEFGWAKGAGACIRMLRRATLDGKLGHRDPTLSYPCALHQALVGYPAVATRRAHLYPIRYDLCIPMYCLLLQVG